MKMTYDLIRKKMGASIDKAVKASVKRYTEEELKEACLDKNKARDLAAKVYFQLPEKIKKNFDENSKARFVEDITNRLFDAQNTKKGRKKILGE